jgi:murein DD-endopeptidase MepM/ murein hydrolase activator NlpD
MSNFICPINTPRLTSVYGMRMHPVLKVKRLHAGIDLVNKNGGKVPVYASAEGRVRLVKTTKDGYGKYVIMTHMVNGQKYETVYAHLDVYQVKVGDKLKQGQQLGIMGNTGIGTGVHLHFEIHKGTYNYGGGNYPTSLNPMNFIKLEETPSTINEKDEGELTVSQYNELKKLIEAQDKEIKELKSKLNPEQIVGKSHTEHWKWAKDVKLMDGNNPKSSVTREQLATVLNRVYNNFLNKK